MSTRKIRSAVAASLIIAGSLALGAGCGDDEDEGTPAVPLPPPTVRITALRTSSGKSFEVGSGDPAEVDAGCDPKQTLVLEIVIEPTRPVAAFRLRPPGACAGIAQCGTVSITVESPGGESRTLSSAALSTPIRLADLPFVPGEHVFRVELRDGAGQPVSIPQAVTTDSISVNVRAPTSCSKDAGSDAADATDAGEHDAADGGAGDAAPDVSSDAPFDAIPDALDAATGSDSHADAADADQG